MMDKESTVKSQFLLPLDAVVSLSYEVNGRQKGCEVNEAGTTFLLPDRWPAIQFFVDSNKAPSRPATPADQGATNPKRQKLDPAPEQLLVDGDLAASIGQYALFYNVKSDDYKRCAIPLSTKLAATFQHGENKKIKIDDEIVIRSWSDEKFNVKTRVVRIIEELDVIILKSDEKDLCNQSLPLSPVPPQKGMEYLMMGFSILHNKTSHLSLSAGIIASDVKRRFRYTGSSGSFKGDSGGGCWNKKGQLIGMQVEVEKVGHTKDDKGRPASPACGGRCCIVAVYDILVAIRDLLPPADSDEEYEWNE
ncbi:unnamed protein product, partial [Mesorhabditis belari]|uniref:Uncharacterized protein n=1 Tax=Mesorhabditis belari TaxID=2138241 RepID=A0AAF3FJF6_9BILA